MDTIHLPPDFKEFIQFIRFKMGIEINDARDCRYDLAKTFW
jgi:hypothetical protein